MNAALTLYGPKRQQRTALPVKLKVEHGRLVMDNDQLLAELNLSEQQMTELAGLLERQVWQHHRKDAVNRQGVTAQ